MTEDTTYIELHSTSAFSFLAGASQPEALIERAAELNMPAIALADRNGLYGVARFHTAAMRTGVQAHIGAEIAVSSFGNRMQPSQWLPHQPAPEPSRIVLLCASQIGYQNLCQLITRFKMREPGKAEGAATLEDLEEFSAGLICLTGGDEGPLAAALARGGLDEARAVAERLTSIYGRSHLYLECQRHHDRAEESRNQALLHLASSLDLPVIATNGVRAATEHDRELLDVFTAIRHHTPLDQAGRLLTANAARFLRSPREMAALFRDMPKPLPIRALSARGLNSHSATWAMNFRITRFPAAKPWTAFSTSVSRRACANAMDARPAAICWTRRERRCGTSSP
jgi:error-prone DNA polymerase